MDNSQVPFGQAEPGPLHGYYLLGQENTKFESSEPMSNSTKRRICYAVIFACIAFICVVAILWGLSHQRDVGHPLRQFCESTVTVAFLGGAFAVLAALIVVVLTPANDLTRESLKIDEQPPIPDSQISKTIDDEIKIMAKTIDALTEETKKAKRQAYYFKLKATNIRDHAVRFLAMRYSFYAALSLALVSLAASALQNVLNGFIGDYEKIDALWKYFPMFAYSLTCGIGCFCIGFYYYRRFLLRTRNRDFINFTMIAGFGIFAVGAISFCVLGATLLDASWPDKLHKEFSPMLTYLIPLFQIPVLAFMFLTRCFVFPLVGLSGASLASRMYRN